MQPLLNLTRYKMSMFIGVLAIVVVSGVLFYLKTLLLDHIGNTIIVPIIIIVGFATYFYYERAFIYKTHMQYRS
ncbi:hypothetical protein ACFFIX_19755 [Metabacillus herbersteinensis]|uniref:Uncharacterized protein n=1 Tax=Metabacillus herbersteinensis TaxID=283816 RepID=A0ABV6GIW2_9BACI